MRKKRDGRNLLERNKVLQFKFNNLPQTHPYYGCYFGEFGDFGRHGVAGGGRYLRKRSLEVSSLATSCEHPLPHFHCCDLSCSGLPGLQWWTKPSAIINKGNPTGWRNGLEVQSTCCSLEDPRSVVNTHVRLLISPHRSTPGIWHLFWPPPTPWTYAHTHTETHINKVLNK